MNWAVVYVIHARTPHQHIAKLFIEDVPEDVTAKDLRSALTKAGYSYGEFGTPWANHYLSPETEWRDEVVGAYKRGNVQIINWVSIAPQEPEVKRITLRLPIALWQAVAEEAEKQGISINTFTISALSRAVAESKERSQ